MPVTETAQNSAGSRGARERVAGAFILGRWLRAQALAALVIAAVAWVAGGRVPSYSSLFGSMAVLFPTLVFALVLGRRIGSDSTAFLGAAVIAELLKWLVCGAICIAVFVGVEPLAAGWFFTGMGLVILAGWLGLFFSS
ncbi:MAG: ATP synthase subunit I [Xanthomonadales bacterium]|jgi:F0F1-type ATP synthase assembly protein I|nr:ATP synthase subunit I [Xanthomonadales bacterium]